MPVTIYNVGSTFKLVVQKRGVLELCQFMLEIQEKLLKNDVFYHVKLPLGSVFSWRALVMHS